MLNLVRKCAEMARISATFCRATVIAPFFFTLGPPRRAPPFLVCTSGAVALKVAQVPSTANLQHEDCNLKVLQ